MKIYFRPDVGWRPRLANFAGLSVRERKLLPYFVHPALPIARDGEIVVPLTNCTCGPTADHEFEEAWS